MWNYMEKEFRTFKQDMDKAFLGFDKLFENVMPMKTGYPPYDVRNYEDGSVRVEVACAGFSESELSVQASDSKLYIKGEKQEGDTDEGFSHRGIAKRNFSLTFTISSGLAVDNARYQNGLLTVVLKPVVNQNLVKEIPINKSTLTIGDSTKTGITTSGKQLLTEDKKSEE